MSLLDFFCLVPLLYTQGKNQLIFQSSADSHLRREWNQIVSERRIQTINNTTKRWNLQMLGDEAFKHRDQTPSLHSKQS